MSSSNSSSSTRNFIPIQCKYNRVVVLVDMDCFYCQVEEKLDPTLKGQPLAVVQYNAWRGGGIIAVNYAARAKGVTRHMRGADAKEQCPEIQLVKVPSVREKADLTKYREAGKDVASVLQRFTHLLERASVDEAYMDITEKVNKRLEEMNAGSFVLQPQDLMTTYALGYSNLGEYMNIITAHFKNPYAEDHEAFQQAHDETDAEAVRSSDIRLLVGASIAGEIRAAVKAETGFECSAGIAHNKILAKLACGINKPNKQTILPLAQISNLFETLPVGKITGLGGKFGEEICERLNVRFLGQLLKYTEMELQKKFDEKYGTWLYNISRGIELEAVTPRFYSKSIGCCKKFPGRNNIHGIKTLKHWLNELATEICDRLEKDLIENNRRAKQMVVSFIQEFNGGEEISSSRSAPLSSYDNETIAKQSLDVIQLNTKQFFRAGNEMVLNNPIKFLGISVGKFETITNAQSKLKEMFAKQAAKTKKDNEMNGNNETYEDKRNELGNKAATKKKVEKESNRNSGEQKMKSFFANYLQGKHERQQNIITAKVEVQEQNPLNVNSGEIQDNISHKQQSTTHTESNSFFANVLKRKNNKDELSLEEITNKNKYGNSDLESSSNSLFCNILPQAQAEDLIFNNLNVVESNHTPIGKLKYKENDALNNLITMNADMQMVQSEIENKAFPSLENCEVTLFTDDNMFDANTDEVRSKKRKFTEIADSTKTHHSHETADYKGSYAEFAIPELRPEYIQFTKCETCNAQVPNDERSLQMHQDHHIAQQLSQQQRIEYREEIKKKVGVSKLSPLTSKNTSKKLKKVSCVASKASKSNITKFLKTITAITTPPPSSSVPAFSLEPSTSSNAVNNHLEDETQICNECKLPIKKAEMPEHQDFHMAKELQKKLNQLEVRTVTIEKKSNKSVNSSLVKSQERRNSTTKAASITQFFSQPNY